MDSAVIGSVFTTFEPDDEITIDSFFSSSRLFVVTDVVVELVVIVIAASEAEFETEVGGGEALLDNLLFDWGEDAVVSVDAVLELTVDTVDVTEVEEFDVELTAGTKDVSIIAILVVSLLLLELFELFTFDELLLLLDLDVRVFVVFVKDFVQSGS